MPIATPPITERMTGLRASRIHTDGRHAPVTGVRVGKAKTAIAQTIGRLLRRV